jgi:glycosyltransferase domain-containing protein
MKNKNFSKKLTILIVTYNRPQEVLKKINFWKDHDFKICIIDGSKKKLKLDKNYRNIKYFHQNEFQYYKRVFYMAKKISTKYIKLESDDDYFSPTALTKSIEFLEKQKSFSAVSGKCGIYSSYKKQTYINSIFNNQKSLLQKNSFKRLQQYFLSYSPALFYSVMRREVFQNNIRVLKQSIKEYGLDYEKFSEIHLPLSICLSGKVKVINYLYWIRKDDDISLRVPFKSIKKIESIPGDYTKMFEDFYKKVNSNYFDKFISNLIKFNTKKNVNFISNQNLKLIIYNYYTNTYRTTINRKNFKILNKIKKLFFLILPNKIKKIIRFHLRINGPSIDDILSNKTKLNYKFVSNEMKKFKFFLLH